MFLSNPSTHQPTAPCWRRTFPYLLGNRKEETLDVESCEAVDLPWFFRLVDSGEGLYFDFFFFFTCLAFPILISPIVSSDKLCLNVAGKMHHVELP